MIDEHYKMSELLPCPFCGETAEMHYLYYGGLNWEIYWVSCQNCSAEIKEGTMTEKNAVDAWNRRTATNCEQKAKPEYPPVHFEDLVEEAPIVGGWVSVKDRLPEDTKQKIVFHKRGVSFAYFSGLYWWSSIGGRHGLDTVTHWMPLPEPPKEDEE